MVKEIINGREVEIGNLGVLTEKAETVGITDISVSERTLTIYFYDGSHHQSVWDGENLLWDWLFQQSSWVGIPINNNGVDMLFWGGELR